MQTISNIFALQTTFQHEQCGQRQQEEMLGRSSWNVNAYCTRAGYCEDKLGYLQNVEGGRDALMVQLASLVPRLFPRAKNRLGMRLPTCRVADGVAIYHA